MLARNDWLRLGVASIGDVPVAAQIWMVCHGKASIYKLAYDKDYSGLSPGTVLTAHLMRYVIEADGVREVDYLIGDDPYKKAWMNGRRERWGIVAYNPRVIAGVAGLVREGSGRVVKRVLAATGARSREQR